MHAELKVVGGKQNNQVVPLPQGKFLIGREQDCHLRPNSELVSRHHCVFTTDEFGIRVRDLGSTNGTLVNGKRIEKQVALQPGDKVVVGSLNFEVVIHHNAPVAVGAGAESPAAPPEPVAPPVQTDDGAPAGSETVFNLPAVTDEVIAGDDTQAMNGGDTTMIPAQQPAAQPPGYPPQMPYTPPPMQYPAGYGQYQPQPQPQMPGYPPQMPGYPPQMPGYPPQMPGYPPQMPGYPPQMPPQQQMPMPQQPPAPTVPEPAAEESEYPEVTLPKPSETGAKEVAKPAPKSAEEGGPAVEEENPSNSAGDIIQKYTQRRPG